MNEITTSRFKGAPWFDKEPRRAVVGGAGSLGSFTAFLLARMNVKPIVFDFDKVEEHNLAGQLFSRRDIGKLKVEAVANFISNYADMDITYSNSEYTDTSLYSTYMFSCFDSMKARKVFFNRWLEAVKVWTGNKIVEPLLIDTRLNFENMQIYCVTPDRAEMYEKTLFDDDKILDEVCTLKSTTHVSCMASSHAVAFFTNHLTNCVSGEKDRELPFRWDYIIPMNTVINE